MARKENMKQEKKEVKFNYIKPFKKISETLIVIIKEE